MQHEHIGLDYTIIGKQLAKKWSLPEKLTLAIWMQHTKSDILKNFPKAKDVGIGIYMKVYIF